MALQITSRGRCQSGYALLTSLFLITVLASLFATYMVLGRTEQQLVKTSRDSASGFNAAEAGLNLRAEEIRGIFESYNHPSGEAATSVQDCDDGATGSGDYECKTYEFGNSHSAVTYVSADEGNPIFTIIPPGEMYGGLSAQEYRYTVTSVGRNVQQSNEAILDLTFKLRYVPLFQFAIFFQEDMEFFNGATMTINGPVHSNSDIYMGVQTGGQTDYAGVVTVAGTLYRGLKSQSSCAGYTGTVRARSNPTTYVNLPACSSSRSTVTNVSAWNDNIMLDTSEMAVPLPEDIAAFSDGAYWQKADVRLALRLDSIGLPDTSNSSTGIEVVDAAGNNINAATSALDSATNCPGLVLTGGVGARAVGTSGNGTAGDKLRQFREYQHDATVNVYQRVLEVDMRAFLNCIENYPAIMGGKLLSDTTERGLVFHFTIDGPRSDDAHNNYAVRIRNAASLQSNVAGAEIVAGITVISDYGLNVWGNYNSTGWVPSALIADSIYLLSNSWTDLDSYLNSAWDRDGTATTVYAAVLSGIVRTGGVNGPGGQNGGDNTAGGGVINVFRFNEWFRPGPPNFTFVGSIVSLGAPLHTQSAWGPFTYYSAPNRNWSFDTRFNDADQLPPMTPALIYLRQELFVRDYEL